MTKTTPSSYCPCACRDCVEIAIGKPGSYCHGCDDAGCPGYQGRPGMSQECQATDDPGCRIAELCQAQGSFPIAALSDGPAAVVLRLCGVLSELAGAAVALPAIPPAALADDAHPAWNGGAAEAALLAILEALNAHAPEGFAIIIEAEQIGFYSLAGIGF